MTGVRMSQARQHRVNFGGRLVNKMKTGIAQGAIQELIELRIQLQRYELTLNAADIDGIMELYAENAVFMPQHSLPVVGRDAVRSAYRHVFDTIKLNIRFEIDEVRPLSSDWAFARTRSTGTVKVLASDQAPIPEANQELFVLHREDDGQWRFVRYIFSTTNPPTQR